MESKAQDYYDIEVDLLPGANFAGRPVSEIYMLDCLWTHDSDSLSLPDECDGTSLTQRGSEAPKLVGNRQTLATGVEENKKLKVTTLFASYDASPSESTNMVNLARTVVQQQPSRQSQTTPSRPIDTQEAFTPVRPRKANSLKMGYSGTPRGRNPQSHVTKRHSATIGMQNQPSYSSFSQKTRIENALENKQMTMLDIPGTGNVTESPTDYRNSILQTPKHLYGFVHLTTSASATSPDLDQRRRALDVTQHGPSHAGQQGSEEPEYCGTRNAACVKEPRSMYLPGLLVAEKYHAHLRKVSDTRMGPLSTEVDMAEGQLSDIANLDDMAVFFDDLVFIQESSEQCLDRYWLVNKELLKAPSSERTYTADQVDEFDGKTAMPQASGFSFSSASSTASESPSGPKKGRVFV